VHRCARDGSCSYGGQEFRRHSHHRRRCDRKPGPVSIVTGDVLERATGSPLRRPGLERGRSLTPCKIRETRPRSHRREPTHIDKQKIVDLLTILGDRDEATQAKSGLPDPIDTDQDPTGGTNSESTPQMRPVTPANSGTVSAL